MAGITIPQFSQLVQDLYDNKASSFDYISTGDIAYGLKDVGGATAVVLEGSRNITTKRGIVDWFCHDLCAFDAPVDHCKFGLLHAGFWWGMQDCYESIKKLAKPPYIVGGHSLGAAHTADMAAIMKDDGFPPLLIVQYAPPRAGGKQLAAYLADIPRVAYFNKTPTGHDLVPTVPWTLPPLDAYCQIQGFTQICEEPPEHDPYGPLKYHHFPLYQTGSDKLFAVPPGV